jgi:hypothetical protein
MIWPSGWVNFSVQIPGQLSVQINIWFPGERSIAGGTPDSTPFFVLAKPKVWP